MAKQERKTRADIMAELERIDLGRVLYDRPKFLLLEKGDGFLLQFTYYESDVNGGVPGDPGRPVLQKARKWYLSPYSTDTEIIRTAYKAVRTSLEHRLGEHFRYLGVQVYSPHMSVHHLMNLNEQRHQDKREPPSPLEVPFKEVRHPDFRAPFPKSKSVEIHKAESVHMTDEEFQKEYKDRIAQELGEPPKIVPMQGRLGNYVHWMSAMGPCMVMTGDQIGWPATQSPPQAAHSFIVAWIEAGHEDTVFLTSTIGDRYHCRVGDIKVEARAPSGGLEEE